MRREGIYAVPEREYERRKSVITLTQISNLLAPKPDTFEADQVRCSDVTFVKTAEGRLHLAAVKELAYQADFVPRGQAESATVEFIGTAYNSCRPHSRPGYQAPNEFERRGLERPAA